MINQVVPNNAPRYAFINFQQPKNGWYLSTPKHEEHKNKYVVPTVVTAALVIGFGTLGIMKGALAKKAVKYLEKIKIQLEKKVEAGGNFVNFYKGCIEHINSFRDKAQSVNNITSLKDILFQKLMFTTNITKRIHKGITRFFSNISRKAVNISYGNTERKMAEFNEYLLALNERIISKNPSNRGIIENINARISLANEHFSRGFGVQARTGRLSKLEKATEDLYDYMWNASYSDIKNFKSKNMYQTFIAEEKMLPFKSAINKEVSGYKSNVMGEISKALEEYKKILPEEQYNLLQSKAKAFQKSLDKSIRNETVKYIDKARDLKLGSAPTDVLSILFATGTVGWFLGKSKNKDEKISSSLKYGIPVIGAIGTTLICTAQMIAGSKALAMGLISGWLMSKMGALVDNTRKQYALDISLAKRESIKPQSDIV